MSLDFAVSGGSAAGHLHRKVGKNRQDAYAIIRTEDAIIAIVADGCGTSEHSEIGAALATRLLSESLRRHLANGYKRDRELLRRVQQDTLSQLAVLASAMGPSLSEVVNNYLLFTVLGVVITPEDTTFFGLGDGVYALNGTLYTLEPEAGNKPIYLAYALTGSELTDQDPTKLDLSILQQLPTEEVSSFLIGSDGANDMETEADKLLPGLNDPIGSLSQFWEDPKFTDGKTFLGRKLNLVTRTWHRKMPNGNLVNEGGKVDDDITVVAGRNLQTLNSLE